MKYYSKVSSSIIGFRSDLLLITLFGDNSCSCLWEGDTSSQVPGVTRVLHWSHDHSQVQCQVWLCVSTVTPCNSAMCVCNVCHHRFFLTGNNQLEKLWNFSCYSLHSNLIIMTKHRIVQIKPQTEKNKLNKIKH